MQTIKAGEGQTLIDIAMQYMGNSKRAMELSALNELSLTADLLPGQLIKVLSPAVEDKKKVDEFTKWKLCPASGDQTVIKPEGIGFWIIGIDFKVS